jgi:hypothetical protein
MVGLPVTAWRQCTSANDIRNLRARAFVALSLWEVFARLVLGKTEVRYAASLSPLRGGWMTQFRSLWGGRWLHLFFFQVSVLMSLEQGYY